MICILFFFLPLKPNTLSILIVQGVVYFACLENKVHITQIPRSICNILVVKLTMLDNQILLSRLETKN
jgi:hypothetical protein